MRWQGRGYTGNCFISQLRTRSRCCSPVYVSQQSLFTTKRREKSWVDAQPGESSKCFLDYIKQGGFYLFFFNTWVQVPTKLPQNNIQLLLYYLENIDISRARYLWLYSAWHNNVTSAQPFGNRYITLWLILLCLLLFPSVSRHIVLSQNRKDNCVCVEKRDGGGGWEGVSQTCFLLHIIFFSPKKRKSSGTK